MGDFIIDVLAGLITIALVVGLVYLIVLAATMLWTSICVGVFGWPMLTKLQMFGLICLIQLLFNL